MTSLAFEQEPPGGENDGGLSQPTADHGRITHTPVSLWGSIEPNSTMIRILSKNKSDPNFS